MGRPLTIGSEPTIGRVPMGRMGRMLLLQYSQSVSIIGRRVRVGREETHELPPGLSDKIGADTLTGMSTWGAGAQSAAATRVKTTRVRANMLGWEDWTSKRSVTEMHTIIPPTKAPLCLSDLPAFVLAHVASMSDAQRSDKRQAFLLPRPVQQRRASLTP